MRDLAGFVETRQQLLTLKPNHRMNWIGFAVSHHLNSNVEKAIDILEAYEGTLEDDYPPFNERCEHGEMLLYKEWDKPKPGRRPDIFPQFSPMKTPLPPPMPADPPEEDEEEEEKKEEDPEKQDPDKPEQ